MHSPGGFGSCQTKQRHLGILFHEMRTVSKIRNLECGPILLHSHPFPKFAKAKSCDQFDESRGPADRLQEEGLLSRGVQGSNGAGSHGLLELTARVVVVRRQHGLDQSDGCKLR